MSDALAISKDSPDRPVMAVWIKWRASDIMLQHAGPFRGHPDEDEEQIVIRAVLLSVFLFLFPPPDVGCQEKSRTLRIGISVQGRTVQATRIGDGGPALLVIGGIHGDEANTERLVRGLNEAFATASSPSASLYFLPAANPDGLAAGTRWNARGVDLNRNWPTRDWREDPRTSGGIRSGAGGSAPGSEPEVRALAEWLRNELLPRHETLWVLSYHSAYPPLGAVQPGYLRSGEPAEEASDLAETIAVRIGSKYLASWPGLTGELIHWCATNGIVAVDIELPTRDSPHPSPTPEDESLIDTHAALLEELLLKITKAGGEPFSPQREAPGGR